jgi:PPOX class probable F420-dependent enzyme
MEETRAMMNQAERRAFVADHRTCIFGFQRKHGPPSMSVVYYVLDGDDILISTMAERAKARAVQRTREAAICVLDEQWPLTYLQVYGPAVVEDALGTTVDVMMKVGQIMSGQPLPEAVRPFVEAKAREEHRVVIRLTPQWTVYSPPVHLNAGDDGSKLQHGLAERLAWKA